MGPTFFIFMNSSHSKISKLHKHPKRRSVYTVCICFILCKIGTNVDVQCKIWALKPVGEMLESKMAIFRSSGTSCFGISRLPPNTFISICGPVCWSVSPGLIL